MIEFLADLKRRIVLVRYSSELSAGNLTRLDKMAADFVAREGAMDGIIDFSDIPTFDIPTAVVADHGRARRRMSGYRRVFIVKDELAFGMLRMYGAYQENHDEDAPSIVYSLAEALALLDAEGAVFAPVAVEPRG